MSETVICWSGLSRNLHPRLDRLVLPTVSIPLVWFEALLYGELGTPRPRLDS